MKPFHAPPRSLIWTFALILGLGVLPAAEKPAKPAAEKLAKPAAEKPDKPETPAKPAAKKPAKIARRIVIGDVHGDFRAFEKLLRRLELTDENGKWTGGKERLIQTGDLVDRGPDSRQAIELLMKLQPQAEKAGGRVTVLIGNHEVMMLTGRFDYVSEGEFAAFGKDETTEFRAARRTRLLTLIQKGSPLLRSKYYAGLARQVNARTFDRVYPRGYFALRRAFSREGKDGKWLLQRSFLHRDLDTLFVHGGISPRYAHLSTEAINEHLKSELETYLTGVEELARKNVFDMDFGFFELHRLIQAEQQAAGGPHPDLRKIFTSLDRVFNSGLLLTSNGPTWYRGLAQNNEREFAESVKTILTAQKVQRIVMGHTVTMSKRIEGRFGNSVILIDTGMNQDHYGGRPSALLFQPDGGVRVFE